MVNVVSMPTEKTLTTHSSEVEKSYFLLQKSIGSIAICCQRKHCSLTVVIGKYLHHGSKEKLDDSLVTSQTKFIFGTRILFTTAILPWNLCTNCKLCPTSDKFVIKAFSVAMETMFSIMTVQMSNCCCSKDLCATMNFLRL